MELNLEIWMLSSQWIITSGIEGENVVLITLLVIQRSGVSGKR